MNLSSVYKFSPFFNGISHTFDKNIIKQITSKDFTKKLVSDVFLEFRKEFNFKDSLRLTKNHFFVFFTYNDLENISASGLTLKNFSCLADALIEITFNEIFNQFNDAHILDKKKFSIICLGKLGFEELNASSDIDVVFLYLDNNVNNKLFEILKNFFTEISRTLSEVTKFSFVYRVDTRLRPFGVHGDIFTSPDILSKYFYDSAEDIERLAWAKARLLINSNKYVIDIINSFVYRNYSDYSIINSLYSMHQRIIKAKTSNLTKNDIKNTNGGLRQLEFFIHVKQVLYGGKFHALQKINTENIINKLYKLKILDKETTNKIIAIYFFYRDLENRIQYLNNEQSYVLPVDKYNLENISISIKNKYKKEMFSLLNESQEYIFSLFAGMFKNINQNSNISYKDYKVYSRHEISNDKLSKELNSFFQSKKFIAAEKNVKESTYIILDNFLSINRSPNYLSLENLLKLLSSILLKPTYIYLLRDNFKLIQFLSQNSDYTSWLINELSKFPYLFDELIYEKLNESVIKEKYTHLLSFFLKKQKNVFESLNLLADFKVSCVFISTISLLEDKISICEYSNLLSLTADYVVKISYKLSCHHNNFFPDKLNLVAFGRYGSKEMGPDSDLDLLFLCEDDIFESKKYNTLIKTFTNILSTVTHFGKLYKVDFRLRPNGDHGFLLSNYSAFLKYHGSSAFWEKLVFTRSRIIIGNKSFKNSFNKSVKKIIFDSLSKISNLAQEILSIRNKIINHYEGVNLLRKSEGSMIDIEFLSQYLLLKNITSSKNSNFEIPLSVDFILMLLDKNVYHSDLKKVSDLYNKFRILEIKKSIYPASKIKQLEDEVSSMKKNVLSLFNKYISS